MSKIDIRTVPSSDDRKLPIFREIDEIADRIRVHAFNLFRSRGSGGGSDVDDWLAAEREICWPAAELIEEDDEFEVRVALAGFEPGDVEITVTPGELIIKARRELRERGKKRKKQSTVRFSEFQSDEVYRRIALPEDIDVNSVEAKLKNGMLEIEADKVGTGKISRKATVGKKTIGKPSASKKASGKTTARKKTTRKQATRTKKKSKKK